MNDSRDLKDAKQSDGRVQDGVETCHCETPQSNILILSGSSNRELSEEVAAKLGTKLGACKVFF